VGREWKSKLYESANSSFCDGETKVLHVLHIYYMLPLFSCQHQKIYHAVNYNGSMTLIHLHQQNVVQSLGASRSDWEDVECKLRSINFRSGSDPRRAFQPAFTVTGISDDCYWSTMWVLVIRFGALWSSGANIVCTWKCHWTNAGITNILWGIPRFLWLLTWTAGVNRDSPDVH